MLHRGLRGHVAPCEATSHNVPAIPAHPGGVLGALSVPAPSLGEMHAQGVPCFGRGGYFLQLVFLFLSKSPRC